MRPLRQTGQKPVLQAAPWKARMLDTCSNFSLHQEKKGVGSFFLIMLGQGERLWRISVMNFPVGFNIADFILACGAGASYLVSGFLTKGIVVCIVVNLVSKYERESLVLPSMPSCWQSCFFVLYQAFTIINQHFWKLKHEIIGIYLALNQWLSESCYLEEKNLRDKLMIYFSDIIFAFLDYQGLKFSDLFLNHCHVTPFDNGYKQYNE